MGKIFNLIAIIILFGCSTYRHKIDSTVSEEKLVRVLGWELSIVSIDGDNVKISKDLLYGRSVDFLVSEGKHKIELNYRMGKLRSKASKMVSIDGKAGDVYMICAITNAEKSPFFSSEGIWDAFQLQVKPTKKEYSAFDIKDIYEKECMSAENMKRLEKKK